MYSAHHDVFRVLYAAGKLHPDDAGRAITRSGTTPLREHGVAGRPPTRPELLRPGL